jgi:hypothetical protein
MRDTQILPTEFMESIDRMSSDRIPKMIYRFQPKRKRCVERPVND